MLRSGAHVRADEHRHAALSAYRRDGRLARLRQLRERPTTFAPLGGEEYRGSLPMPEPKPVTTAVLHRQKRPIKRAPCTSLTMNPPLHSRSTPTLVLSSCVTSSQRPTPPSPVHPHPNPLPSRERGSYAPSPLSSVPSDRPCILTTHPPLHSREYPHPGSRPPCVTSSRRPRPHPRFTLTLTLSPQGGEGDQAFLLRTSHQMAGSEGRSARSRSRRCGPRPAPAHTSRSGMRSRSGHDLQQHAGRSMS